MAKMFMIISKVCGISYLAKVETDTALTAEHYILDMGICGRHEYGVDACMAYDFDAMKTEAFRYEALAANPISLAELVKIIEEHNEEIKAKDEAEKMLQDIEKERREITERLDALLAMKKDALALLNG